MLEPTSGIFRSGKDVGLRVLLSNSGIPCYPALLDEDFASEKWGQRPFTLVTLKIWNDRGEAVPQEQAVQHYNSDVKPGELILLDCHSIHGVEISPVSTASDWRYHFPKGRYTARATVTIRTLSYFKDREEFLTRVAVSKGHSVERVRQMLLDETFESGDATFEVLE